MTMFIVTCWEKLPLPSQAASLAVSPSSRDTFGFFLLEVIDFFWTCVTQPPPTIRSEWAAPELAPKNPISRKRLRSPSSFSDSKTARLSFHCISVVQPNKARRLPKESDKEKKLGRIWVKLDVETSWSTVLASEVPESAWNLRRWFDVTSIPKWDFTWPTTQPTNHDTLPGPRIAYSQ